MLSHRIPIEVALQTFGATWRHLSRDHLIAHRPHMPFPISGPLERSLQIKPFSRYCALRVLGSQVWHFKVMWPSDNPSAISYWWSFRTMPISVTVSEIFNFKCNAIVDVTLIRPLNKGQGHSFWYQSISHIRLRTSYRLSIPTFAPGRTV